MGNNGVAMPKRVRSVERPSERSERLERLVRCATECGNTKDEAANCLLGFDFTLFPVSNCSYRKERHFEFSFFFPTKCGEPADGLVDLGLPCLPRFHGPSAPPRFDFFEFTTSNKEFALSDTTQVFGYRYHATQCSTKEASAYQTGRNKLFNIAI